MSAKLLISEHHDSQICQVDIYAEELLRRLTENDLTPDFYAPAAQTDYYGADKRCIKSEPDADSDEEDEDGDNDLYKYHEPYSHKYKYDEETDEAVVNLVPEPGTNARKLIM